MGALAKYSSIFSRERSPLIPHVRHVGKLVWITILLLDAIINTMKKYIIFGLVLSLFISPVFVSAQLDDIDPETTGDSSACVSLQNNLKHKMRDANTNGEVSILQDFLQSEDYLTSEPTGYFGLATLRAVKAFQKANNLRPTGYVGPLTRAKIKAVSCGETDQPIVIMDCYDAVLNRMVDCKTIPSSPPVTSPVDLKVNGSDGPVSIVSGSAVIFSWKSAPNVASCAPIFTKSGTLWTNSIFTNGNQISFPIVESDVFSIKCQVQSPPGVFTTVVDSVTVNVGITPINPATLNPFTDPNYSETSQKGLFTGEKTVTYQYPHSPCGSLMSSHSAVGSVFVGRGPVYNMAVNACGVNSIPDDSSFRTYACNNVASGASVLGNATFAFKCKGNSTTPAPLVTLTASQTSVTAGHSVALTWTSNATNGCDASNIPGGSAFSVASGSTSIGPTQTRTYSVTCYGGYGSLDSALATTASVTVHVNPVVSTLLGDANLDGVVNIIDAQQIARYVSGLTTFTDQQKQNADVNRDGVITTVDADLISKYSVGLITSFPALTATLLGDANLDGAINTMDAQHIARYIASLTVFSGQQLKNADVNGNGVVTTVDADLVSKYSVGLITSFPASNATLLGDANLDGAVNVIDAQQISRFVGGLTVFSGQQLKNADVNRDGVVNTTDSDLVAQYSVGLITSFPTGSVLGASDSVYKFTVGQNIKVKIVGNLNVRVDAGVSSQSLGAQPNGALGTIVDGPRTADGYTWWKVDYATQQDGWSVEDYLVAN